MKNRIKYILIIIMMAIYIGLVPIEVKANSISINKNEMILGVGYTETLKLTTTGGINSSNVIWKSSNEKVATVNSNGKVTAITEGTTIITAYTAGYSSTCIVKVSSEYVAINGIQLNKGTLNLLIGTSETLIKTVYPSNATNKDVNWKSSNPQVASIDSTGKVIAKEVGTTIITVYASGYSATCIVNVVDKVELKGISLNKTTLNIKEKTSETLNVQFNPTNATNKKITWRTSNKNVATVDEFGKVTGVSAGNATITAVSNDGGYVGRCEVQVEAISKKVTSVSLDKTELKIVAGEETMLKAIINPNYAENQNITWESSDKKIVTVQDGKITALNPGTAEIKVITEDGNKEAICKVTVTSPLIKNIKFEQNEKTVYIGSKTTLKTVNDPVNSVMENATWTSSNENVATINNGVVTAISQGETTITISNENKTITASINIKVIQKPKEKLNISVEKYDLNFNPETKDYTLEIGNENEIVINTNVSNDKVVINGNQNLKNGSIITITINDEEKVTYVIKIKKKENYTIIFIAIISIILLLNLIRIMIKSKKRK